MSSYRQIDLSEWTLVGEGYNGQAFVSPAFLAFLKSRIAAQLSE